MSLETASQTIAHRRHGSNEGQPLTRRDGVLKVTGRATYAADNHLENMLFAVTVPSSIARSTKLRSSRTLPGKLRCESIARNACGRSPCPPSVR